MWFIFFDKFADGNFPINNTWTNASNICLNIVSVDT